jgi:hypothetical protein
MVSAAVIAVVLEAPSNRLVRSSPVGAPSAGRVQGSLVDTGRLPLVFESNLGQADRQVKFLSRGNNYTLWLTTNEAVLEIHRSTTSRVTRQALVPSEMSTDGVVGARSTIRMRMIGANPGTTLTGLVPLAATTSYFIGKDPARWRSHVPTFSQVRYENAYSGIDLVFHGEQRALEYDWVVKPGGDPRAIELAF